MDNRIAVVQMNSGDDVAANLACADGLIESTTTVGTGLVVLPEMFAFIGREPRNHLDVCEDDGEGPIQDFLAEAAAEYGVWLVGGTFPMRSPRPDRAYAACAMYDPRGRRVALYRKMHLFDVHLHETGETYGESDVFTPGDEVVVVDTPFGRCGLAVCYDLRFPELFRAMLDRGVELIVLPSAFTATTGEAHWEPLLRARAIENLAYVAAANQVGKHANGRETWGHSMVVDPWGEVINQLSVATGSVMADLDLDFQAHARRAFPSIKHRRLKGGGEPVA